MKGLAQAERWILGRNAGYRNIEEGRRGTKRELALVEPPLCHSRYFRETGERHYRGHFPISTKEAEAAKLEDYRKTKKASVDSTKMRKGNVGQVMESTSSSHSALFTVTLENREITKDQITYQAAYAYISLMKTS